MSKYHMLYEEYIKSKEHRMIDCGFDVQLRDLNESMFPFQKALVKWALKRGRAAIFADTGLGKTVMQIEWAKHVVEYTGGKALIVAPLCVSQQTVREGEKFGIKVKYARSQVSADERITITNYEMIDSFNLSSFDAVVIDESSILKHIGAKFRKQIIDACRPIPYRLSCTATPAPNDYMELGGQAEFLGVMDTMEMLAMFFIHDGGDTSKWRLKGHGKTRFWEWMSTWAMVVKKPSDIGFSDEGYDLPELRFHEHIVESPPAEGELFPAVASRLLDRNRARKESVDARVEECSSLVNSEDKEQWLVWCHLNEESDKLTSSIDGAADVKGSQKLEDKEERINDFIDEKMRVMVSKPSIMGYGLNLQGVNKMAFVGLSDSFEQFYQAVRRCWRFGQNKPVDVHIISAQAEGAILQNIKRKETQAKEMSEEMVKYMRESMKSELTSTTKRTRTEYKRDYKEGGGWTLHLGDCVEIIREIEDESIGYTVFSPPFSSLYVYSDSDRDMGNTKGDADFMEHFSYLIPELYRVTQSGRLLSFHCMNLPSTIQNDGVIGLRDFRGELIRLFSEHGWIYHSEVCIWKDPVVAMQRTKALGLLWKQIRKDSSMSRMGIPDYVVTMRKPGVNNNPINHTAEEYPVEKWQQIASPIWTDINQSNTLNKNGARTDDDERHIAPLQLDVIERCLELWSKPDDVVLSPFAGIGSEGYMSIKMGRRFIGVELKKSYFDLAYQNLESAKTSQIEMFPKV